MAVQDRPETARLSHHARERCAEMNVATKRVKVICRNPDVRYQQSDGTSVMRMDSDPTIAVVVDESQSPPMVVTVVFATTDEYVRNGSTFTVVHPV